MRGVHALWLGFPGGVPAVGRGTAARRMGGRGECRLEQPLNDEELPVCLRSTGERSRRSAGDLDWPENEPASREGCGVLMDE